MVCVCGFLGPNATCNSDSTEEGLGCLRRNVHVGRDKGRTYKISGVKIKSEERMDILEVSEGYV